MPEPLSAAEAALLNRLRWWLLKSRLASRSLLDRACFLLAADDEAGAEIYALALFRTLAEGARRRLIFHPPKAAASEDERWLLRLLATARSGDHASCRALIAWRVVPKSQTRVRFLVERIILLLK